jgi:hypothetical protein
LCSNATPINVKTSLAQWTVADHEEYIVYSIQRCRYDNKENLNLKNFTLTDGQQHRLTVKNYLNATLNASLICDCGKLFISTKSRGKFQISNYYRHLKAVNLCKVIKEIKNNGKLSTLSTSMNTQSSPIELSSIPLILSESLSSYLTSSSSSSSGNHTNNQQNASISSISLGSSRAKRNVNVTQSDSASSLMKKSRTH